MDHKNIMYSGATSAPKNTKPIIQKTGTTATIKLGNEELQVIDHAFVMKQSKLIEDQQKQIRIMNEQIQRSNQAIRLLGQEINNIKKTQQPIFRK